RAYRVQRLAYVAGLEAAVGQLLGRLDADQVLKIEQLPAPAPDRRPDEANLRPVAQLALADLQDLCDARESVSGVLGHPPGLNRRRLPRRRRRTPWRPASGW